VSVREPLNPWNYKPWWCQPWSILLTGILLVSGCWSLTQIIWITIPVALLVLAWWTVFLVVWPKVIRESEFFEPSDLPTEDSAVQSKE
jgi:hypothetical protein